MTACLLDTLWRNLKGFQKSSNWNNHHWVLLDAQFFWLHLKFRNIGHLLCFGTKKIEFELEKLYKITCNLVFTTWSGKRTVLIPTIIVKSFPKYCFLSICDHFGPWLRAEGPASPIDWQLTPKSEFRLVNFQKAFNKTF